MMYVVFARRSDREPWAEWSKSPDEGKAGELALYAISCGYEACIVTDVETIRKYRRRANKYYYRDDDEDYIRVNARWYFKGVPVERKRDR